MNDGGSQLPYCFGRINSAIIQFGVVALVTALIVVRSLWVSFPPPAGLPLSRQQAPRLFALVDELTAKLQAPRFHHILPKTWV
ncbi:hypothetical protein [Microseira sp. BLCC-F43]|uniref:hypothetical protein n=1 Tax=Microseira sp. BLCC-F43 TaxID=3153602 RepID=UPI0035BA1AF7